MATIWQLLDKKGHEVLSVEPDETVYDSIKKMADKNVGSLVVMEGDKLLVSVRKHVESSESFVIQGRRSESEGAPMWTKENRGRYDRSRLRYPSDLTDEEWALVEPLIASAKRGGNKRTVDVREVVNGLMYVAEQRLPMASDSEGSAAAQHGARLF
jgi:Putative transposase of IS4/5 family (DUF4096)